MNDWDYLARGLYQAQRPKTLDEAIKKFLSSLELTDRQSDLVAQRQKAVRERAEANSVMDIENSLLIGSYPRETQIRPIAAAAPALDVDALLILKTTTWNLNTYWHIKDGGTKLLKDTHAALSGFPALSVIIDRPSITIKWKEMKMELTPAFHRDGGGYLIPSRDATSTHWAGTNPIGDADALTRANKACNQELKPMIKMLKCWNRHHNRVIGSFAVETQAFHSAGNTFQGYGFEIPYFFGKLLENQNKFIKPPSGIGEELFMYLSPRDCEVIKNSKLRVERAFSQANLGNHQAAIGILAEVFGKPFPGAN